MTAKLVSRLLACYMAIAIKGIPVFMYLMHIMLQITMLTAGIPPTILIEYIL